MFIQLHSTQLHTLDHMLELDGLPGGELTPDHRPSIPDLIPIVSRTRACKLVMVHGYFSAEEMHMIVQRVAREELCLIGWPDTPEEAVRLQEAVPG